MRFPFTVDYEVVWQEVSFDEATKSSTVAWQRSDEGKLTRLTFGFLFPVAISVDLEKKRILLGRVPSKEPIGPHRMATITNMLSGFFWSLSGRVAMHANGVTLDGEHVVALTGTSGRGKSTLTGYLLGQGARFVSDDILAVEADRTVNPMGGTIKLWPDSMAALGLGEPEKGPRKEIIDVEFFGGEVLQKKLPLTQLFLLEEWDGTSTLIHAEKINASMAPMLLMQNSYFAPLLFAESPSLFLAYAELASKISVYKLHYPRTAHAMPEVLSLIDEVTHGND